MLSAQVEQSCFQAFTRESASVNNKQMFTYHDSPSCPRQVLGHPNVATQKSWNLIFLIKGVHNTAVRK